MLAVPVRTYDVFYRSRETKPKFGEWMEQERVQAGAEPIMVLLAYMEVVRACKEQTGSKPGHAGFWELAEEWHKDTLALPRPSGRKRLSDS